MKKYTLVFATLLAMSGMAFGQKEGKVLWEKSESNTNSIKHSSYISDDKIIESSSVGNILTYYSTQNGNEEYINIKAHSKNGELLWASNDIYKNKIGVIIPKSINKNYFVLRCLNQYKIDSTFLFDKDYKFIRGFKGELNMFEDGVIHSNEENFLIKYDIQGKEIWRYKHQSNLPIKIANSTYPLYGTIENGDYERNYFIVLDSDGKEIKPIPDNYNNNKSFILSLNQSGGWGTNGFEYEREEYFRFDRNGVLKVSIPVRNLISKNSYIPYIRKQSINEKYLLSTYLINNEIYFTRIDSVGKIITIASNCILSNPKFFDGLYDTKILNNNEIIYAIALREDKYLENKRYKIGLINFENQALSWQKEINVGQSDINESQFSIRPDNTFFQISNSNNINVKFLKVYDIKGNIKWESTFKVFLTEPNKIKLIDNYLYINVLSDKIKPTKINYTDGKIIWSHENINISNFEKDIKQDKNGNDIIFYSNDNNDKCISLIDKQSKIKWTYHFPENINSNYSNFIEYDKNIIAFSLIPSDSKYLLRKFIPCIIIDSITITGNTEACPTEKVKLSIPKEDDLTYQWQKDGKDIPNVKDPVYDFGESGTYTVVAKDELCQNSVTSNALKVTIRTLPNAQITAPKSIFCEGEKTIMTATTNGTFFQWQKDQKDIPNATSGIYEVSEAGNYRVGVRDDKCPQVGYSNVYTIITKLLPEANISTDIKGVVYEPFSVKMTANSGTGLAYQWLKDDVIIPNETTLTYEAKKSGKYKVSVTYDGCTKLSDALTISILIPLANQEEIVEQQVQVYPNPSKGEFKIILPKSLKNADIQVFDSFGRERSLTYTGEQAQVEGLAQGFYFLRVQKGEKIVMNKIVIE